MPLHTPSPHRFLAPAPPSTQKSKPKTQSGLRHAVTARKPRPAAFPSRQPFDDVGETKRVTPANRFVVVPSSSHGTPRIGERRKARDQVEDEWARTPATPRPRPPKLDKVESIETTSPSSSATTEARNGHSVARSVEQPYTCDEGEGPADEDEDDDILLAHEERSKRRRISPGPLTSPTHVRSDPELLSSPQVPSPVLHRFQVPAPQPTVFDNTSTPAADRRPHFRLPHPSLSPTKAATPLPETFSPSRKIGRYIPNGMASTLQSWIHETASKGYAASTSSAVVWGRDKDDGVKMKVKISSVMGSRGDGETEVECWPGGVVLVRGTTDSEADQANPADINIMLAGQGGARRKGGVRIIRGGIVGVRAPIWDVLVGDGEQPEKWLVGVEWVLL